MLSHVGWGSAPLSMGNRLLGGSAWSSSILDARSTIVTCGLSRSAQGHVMVSPAVGRKRMEKEPLKQCLKNTCRQVQKTHCCFSFRAPNMRSVGVGEVGTSSRSCVHLQIGRGVRSRPHAAKAACLGVIGGGFV